MHDRTNFMKLESKSQKSTEHGFYEKLEIQILKSFTKP